MTRERAEKIAREFHSEYERIAIAIGYATRTDTREFDPTSKNGLLMIAVSQIVGTRIEKSAFESGFKRGLKERHD